MTLTQLEYLCAIKACGSLRGAARQCGVSEPSISQAIHTLEQELNLALLTKNGRTAALTSAGLRAEQAARAIQAEQQALLRDLQSLQQSAPVRLELCQYEPLPLVKLRSFTDSHPACSLHIKESNALHIIHALEVGECDLGVVYAELLTSRLASAPYGQQEFAAFFSPGHPYEKCAALPHSAIPADFAPTPDFWSLAQNARQGRSAALLPLQYAEENTDLLCRRFSPPLTRPLALAWNRQRFLSRELQTLIETLQKE